MTPKQMAAIERARMVPATFVSIPRVTRFTAFDNAQIPLPTDDPGIAQACLRAEQIRLEKTWRT